MCVSIQCINTHTYIIKGLYNLVPYHSLFSSVLTYQHQPTQSTTSSLKHSLPLASLSPHCPSFPLIRFPLVLHVLCQHSFFCLTIECGDSAKLVFSPLLHLLCVHVFSDCTHFHDFKYEWHADVSHISISSTNFFKIQVYKSSCLLDISMWMFHKHLKPSRSAQNCWLPLPYLPPPVLPISENGTTLHQWLNPKTEASSFMPPFPLPLTSNHSPSPAYSTLPYILNWPTSLYLHCHPLGLADNPLLPGYDNSL